MILAVSRFKVANGLEDEVRLAFAQRPRLVDAVPGFLGMETYTDSKDASVFVLVTRWASVETFRTWHSSEAHARSHSGIPNGLRLDPALTELVVLERLDDPAGRASLEVLATDAPALVSAFLGRTRSIHLLAGRLDGTITVCNEVAASGLGLPVAQVVGQTIGSLLVDPDQGTLRGALASGQRIHRDLRLNLVGPSRSPYTLECTLEVGDGFRILGEAPHHTGRELSDELVEVNAEISVLARENARVKRELAKTLAELRDSHWHIKKLQAVLPMCLECGRVKTAEAQWETPRKFLHANSDFLSHGYCPECAESVKARFLAGE